MELTTERLIMREFTLDDWPAVLAYQRDPLYLRYYEWTDCTPAEAQGMVRKFDAQQREQPRIKFQLAIILKSSGKLIGNCGIRMNSSSAHEADIGYELSPDHWGNGYATEAARAIVRFGFTDLHLHRIEAWCIAGNAASVRVLEKIGMRLEGRQRDKQYFKGRWWDVQLYAMLDDEWRTAEG